MQPGEQETSESPESCRHSQILNDSLEQGGDRITANVVSVEKQKFCLKMLVEGNSIRGTERMHIANYNFLWRSLEKDSSKLRCTPAMQRGTVDMVRNFDDL